MLFMVVERYKPGAAVEIYRRAQQRGRLLPDGLEYLDSWVDLDFKTCFQLMRTENEELFQQWVSQWQDLVDFEIVPVRTSAEAFQLISPRLETDRSQYSER
jgi:hypothetical protein